LPLSIARLAIVGLLGVSLPLAYMLEPEFAAVIGGYLLLMSAYSAYLKHLVIIDVFAIAAGFVLRAAGGAVVLDVPISPWLYVCTVLLALFVGFGKRRHELLLLEESAGSHRRNLDEYSEQLLDQFILITAAATVMAYSLYTFAAANLPANHSMMLTIPFVVYAIFRYLFLVHRRDGGGSPESMLLADRPLLSCIALWGVTTVAILYTM
jgi:4-hydroxybenzoate polyprenyltransferase